MVGGGTRSQRCADDPRSCSLFLDVRVAVLRDFRDFLWLLQAMPSLHIHAWRLGDHSTQSALRILSCREQSLRGGRSSCEGVSCGEADDAAMAGDALDEAMKAVQVGGVGEVHKDELPRQD